MARDKLVVDVALCAQGPGLDGGCHEMAHSRPVRRGQYPGIGPIRQQVRKHPTDVVSDLYVLIVGEQQFAEETNQNRENITL